ncbi:MAG: PspC domain-containing protein [Simkaniaceae bacterium]|nr:PspC domain-containing protein [Simkaniaceae bacterium]
MKIQRCRWDQKIAGVCGGLGRSFNIDPSIIRLLAVFIVTLSGVLPGVVIYFILAVLMPKGPVAYVEMRCKKLYRSRSNRLVAGLCAGLGEVIGIDPVIVRVIFLVSMCLTLFVPLLITYIVGVFMVPERLN